MERRVIHGNLTLRTDSASGGQKVMPASSVKQCEVGGRKKIGKSQTPNVRKGGRSVHHSVVAGSWSYKVTKITRRS